MVFGSINTGRINTQAKITGCECANVTNSSVLALQSRKLKKDYKLSILLFLISILSLFSNQVYAQTCPTGSAAATFAWDNGSGSGFQWPANSTTNSYTVNYTDALGQPNTIDIDVNIIDPSNRNVDSNIGNPNPWGDTASSCGGPIYTAFPNEFSFAGSIQDPWDSDCFLASNATATNSFFGPNFISWSIRAFDHTEDVTFQYAFSKPALMDNMRFTDVDYSGHEFDVNGTLDIREIPGNSFQDELTFSATDSGGANVPLSVTGGSAITVSGQSGRATYNTNLNGNIGANDPAGFVDVSSSAPFTTFNVSYSNGPEDAAAEFANPGDYTYWSAANGPTNGASDGQAITMGGFSFCIQEPPPVLEITKTSSANGGPVSPGDTITYTVEVENTGLGSATNVVVTDTLPAGVTYVASSAEKTYQAGGSGSFSQDMGTGSFDTPGLTQSFTVTSAQVPAGATLDTYGFTVSGTSSDFLSDITLQANYPGDTAFSLGTFSFGGNSSGSFNESRGPSAFGGSALGTYSFVWDDVFNGITGFDNAVSSATFNITYTTPRSSVTDAAGAPPNLVTAAEGIDLLAGELMTITFDVTVDDPLSPAISQLLNTAATSSTELPTPVTDTAIDAVLQQVTISGNVFNDADGLTDSTVDGTGIGTPSGTQVYATLLDASGNVVASTPIAADGSYSFANVSANTDYTVQLSTTDESGNVGSAPSTGPSLPADWVNTGENIGTGAGDDGTVDGLIDVSVVTSDVTQVNFGIEQPPTANDVTEPSQINPGGTTEVQVPALDVTDPEDGTPTTITITEIPNATTEGLLYYNGVVVTSGQVIPNFDPTLLTLDPIDGDVTVDFLYTTTDAAGEESAPATVTMPFTGLSLSGNVFNDADGLTDSTVDGTGIGTPSGTQVYAILLDASGNVVASTPIAADGSYSFANVSANTDYSVQLSTTDESGNVGSAPSTGPSLPADWVNTGENIGAGAGDDGTVDGLIDVSVVSSDVTQVNFGIEQPPTANDVTEPSQINPGGTTEVQVPALDVTDPEDGTPTTITITEIPNATTEGLLYYNGVVVTSGQVIPNFDPTLLTLDPIDGDVTVDFLYTTTDAAGEESAPATVTMPFTGLSLSGNVFNDADGLTDSTVDGTGIGTPSGTQVYATLLDASGNVVASTPIAADGSYSFANVSANTDYSVQLSTTDESGNVGSAPSTGPSLPADWVNTGENIGTGAGDDGTVDGLIDVSVVTSDVTQVNFGIEQPPTANDVTEPSQINPGGTTEVQVPALDVTDPEDGTPTTITITEIPNATTEGLLYYNGVVVTSGQVIPNFDPTLLTLDPIDGDVTVDFLYTTTDAAGEESAPATVTMPFTGLSLSGNVFNDADGLTDSTVDGTGIGTPSGTQVYAILLDASGNVVASTPIAADGSYSFANVSANTDYSVQLSTTDESGNVGSAPSTGPSLPADWVNTGENIGTGAGDDGTVDGLIDVSVVTSDVTQVNFGIEQPPTANDVTEPSQINPGGTTEVQVPALDVTDPEDGTPTTITITEIPNATTEGLLYYNGVVVTSGQVIPNFDPTLLTLDPIDGDVTVDFLYTTTDAAGEESAPATVTMPFTGLSLSGNVFNDADGLTDSTVDGTGIGTPSGTQVYATLLDASGNVVASTPIAADGSYSFANVSANTDYTVQLSTTDETAQVGSAPSTGPSLPADWVNTGENIGTGAGDDGTVDGLIDVSVVSSDVTQVNFGIEQPPTANDVTEPSQINPGGTTEVQVPALDVTDPEDGTPTTITITEIPNATTEGLLYYNGVVVTSGQVIPNFDPTLLTLDPIDGDVTVDFLYTTTDAAGEESAPATVTMPFTGLSTVGDFVWIDTNGDGVQDAGESGIPGVTVTLTPTSNIDLGNGLGVAVTTVTDSTGAYLFADVPGGTGYVIAFDSPTGYVFSPQSNPTDPLASGGDSDANSSGVTALFDVTSGINIDTIDAGLVPGASIGDHIWLDTDGDGVDDIGEQGIAGVTVDLSGTAADGTVINLTTTTDANGDYLFDNLPAGNYTVTVTDSNGVLTDLDQSPGNTGSESVNLAAGQDFLDADFGYVPAAGTAVIGDTVWADDDGDGIQDAGEIGLAGVSLDLIDDNGNVVDTINTDASGNYLFTNVAPGDYTVVVTDTAGVITDPATNVTSGPQSPGSLTSDPITVLPDDVYVDADFGFTAQTGSTLADRIWYDANGDGVQDAGEPGIGSVTVDLLDSNGVIIASVVTDADGNFSFTGLPDADYSIVITDDNGELTGYFSTTPPASSLRQEITGLTGDIVNQDPGAPNPVTSGAGTGHPSFGFNQPATIGDTIWNDANADGVKDPGEGGIAGVTLTLTDSSGSIVDTATTDSNGNYMFTNVPAGTDYTVTVDANNFSTGGALDGYTQTFDADDGTAASDNQSVLSIADGMSNLVQDFGYQNTALPSISGTVFYDVDTDGTHEPDGNDTVAGNTDDENGIAGVTIDLIDSTGNVVATTTTDANGDYSFPDVPVADYTVAVTDTQSVLDGYDLTSGLNVLPVTQAQLNAGDVTDVDFGYVDDQQTAAITSGLWIDSDMDGIRDPDETPIANVNIDLIDCGADATCGTADDTVVGTTSTDIDGNVIFPDLPPGVYALDADESDSDFPSGITEIGNYSGDINNPNDPILLSEGETYDADFGFIPTTGTAGLSGTLWNDSELNGSTGDGVKDASEVGLGGIFVRVTNTLTGAAQITTTQPDGSYSFTGLTPCPSSDPCYSVSYDDAGVSTLGLDGSEPTNTDDLGGPAGPTTPDGVNDDVYMVNLEAGDFKEDFDFGFDAPANTFGAIDGYVYYEPTPANGSRDAGTDTGIESVTLNLVDSNGDVIATTTTSDGFTDVDGDGVIDPAGYYRFNNLVPGNYSVVVTDSNNATIGLNPSGDPDEPGALCSTCDEQSGTITVAAGPPSAAINFGYMGEQSLGNIGNLIWYDEGGPISSGGDSDGMFDPLQGDKGIAGVTVECWFDADGDKLLSIDGVDNLVRTVTTDENGEFYCEGLPTGGYLVRVTDDSGRLVGSVGAEMPAGGSLGADGIPGTVDDLDNANKMAIPLASIPTSGPSPAWYIKTGSDNLTADFAVTGTNNLSGTIFEEEAGTTANGLLDGSDAGTPGVMITVLLEQPDGTFIEFTSTTTAADGSYSFTGLPNGNYKVVVDTSGSAINGYGQTGDPDIPTSFCTSALSSICDDTAGSLTPLVLSGGSSVTDIDFGYQTEFVTTPITLGYFHAQSLAANTIEIKWQTVTEVAHLGFNLYVWEKANGWRRLNDGLIPPAAAGDSFEIRKYTFTAFGVKGKRFALGDVDVSGKETIHGPFKLNRKTGANRAARKVTDWKSIKAKRAANKEARMAKRKARAQKRLEKKLRKAKKKAKYEAQKLESLQGQQVKVPESINQTEDKTDGQEDKEFEMLEYDNEKCELEDCFGEQVGLLESGIDSSHEQVKHHTLASRLLAGLLSIIVPNAYALEPAAELGVVQIETTEAGIYKVTYEDLLEQGIDLTDVFHWKLSLTNNNEPVYIRSWGQKKSVGDRRYFGPGGGFEFVAQANRTLYTKTNVYTLHVDGPKGYRKPIKADKAMLPTSGSVIDYYQHTSVLEPDRAYSTLSPNGDPWFAFQTGSDGAEKTIPIQFLVDNFAAGKGKVETRLHAWGLTTGSHHALITQDGQIIDEKQFTGIKPVVLSGELVATSIHNGVNTYSLTIPGRGVVDHLVLDKVEAIHPRWTIANDSKTLEFEAAGELISVSGLKSKWVRVIREEANNVMTWIPYKRMQRIKQADNSYTIKFPGTMQNATYYVSVITNADRRVANLKLPSVQDDLTTGSASYLIVAHPDFIDANMDRLVVAKQAQGYSVKVADVDAVYTTFGGGRFGADAIRDYINWAHVNLGTQMVLLVGDDMYDYHGNQYHDAISFIPSIYTATSALVKMAPVDAKYVDFDDDNIPDIPIGRLNPKLAQEWAAMVDKTLNYGQHPNPQSIVFSADAFDIAQGYNFSSDADVMLSRLPASWQSGASKYYIDDLGASAARSGLLDALDTGPAVAAFVGHSGPRDWSFSGLLSASDAASMTNNGAASVVTQWGCWNTYYATPNGSMANEFLRNPNGGAVAVLGAIALTEAVHEKAMAIEVYDRLFEPGMSIGEAVLQAKHAYALNNPVSTHKDVILGWTLMADPSLVIQH